ncbi:DMT family transporter [Pelagovum pacificum]|uniref:DMT family transporter n=1 Tax=Pelagovum pacificum TaxID=2588711 RepID=A0A5C5G9W7_9RHOB|nr:DMT family transporter [Pelagovum pacificum]QQA42367.1 DMT family transporter [Pelagovum pacificum]TNY31451.1 DMT family transporter [Pelagovum pacificum]
MSLLANQSVRPSTGSIAGIVAMCCGMMLLPVGDAISKALTGYLVPSQIGAVRAVVQSLILGLALLLWRSRAWGRPFTVWSLISGQLIAIISLSLIAAFKTMPIATAIAIFFVEPLILTLLAGLLLGEKPGPHRYAAIGVGMAGVLLILRPNFAIFGPVVFLPLIGAVAYALNMIVTRKATRESSALTFQFGVSVFSCLTLSLVMLGSGHGIGPVLEMPSLAISGLLISGVVAAVTFLLIALAFSKAEASVLAPFQYLEILGATLIGYLAFGDAPDALTVVGTLIVLGSGMYVFHRERRANLPVRRTQTRRDR